MEDLDVLVLNESILEFNIHFNSEDNHRVLFSAPYGTGKSTFLKHYFEKNDNYIPVFLNPINYSVTSNEDIFQLIKHDILFQILGMNLEFEEIEFTHLETLAVYLPLKIESLFSSFLTFLPKTGNSIVDNAGSIHLLLSKYFKFHEKVKNKSDISEIEKFLKEFTFEKGSIYEEDFITLMIKDFTLKLLQLNKKPVLIIDDLDRLDPEHIFRILNVFSAHYSLKSKENKFDFSKIIVVCDVNNIRSIYQHKFGEYADFSGYIDKFYSGEVYYFNNFYSITGWLNGLNRTLTNQTDKSKIFQIDVNFIKAVLLPLIQHKKFTFRNLRKLNYQKFSKEFSHFCNNNPNSNYINYLLLSKIGFILKNLYGDLHAVYSSLKYMSSNGVIFKDDNLIRYYDNFIFPVLSHNEHRFVESPFLYVHKNDPNNINKFSCNFELEYKEQYCSIINKDQKKYVYAGQTFWTDLKDSLIILEENGVL